MMALRIHCIGGGSIGLLLSSGLCLAGAQVTVVTRTGEQADLLQASGIRLLGTDGIERSVYPEAVGFQEYASGRTAAAEWILVAVKQKDLASGLLEAISVQASGGASVCCFQNGIGHLDKLRNAVRGDLFAAVTTEGARRTEPNRVEHTGRGFTWIGSAEARSEEGESSRLRELVAFMVKAGFEAKESGTIEGEIWNKLIINSAVNPITALLEVPNGELLESADTLELMRALYREAVELAAHRGIRPDPALWDRLIGVCRATARNRSSMLQDLEAGRPTELEWMNGSLLRYAEETGMELPAHRTVYALVRSKERLRAMVEKGEDTTCPS